MDRNGYGAQCSDSSGDMSGIFDPCYIIVAEPGMRCSRIDKNPEWSRKYSVVYSYVPLISVQLYPLSMASQIGYSPLFDIYLDGSCSLGSTNVDL